MSEWWGAESEATKSIQLEDSIMHDFHQWRRGLPTRLGPDINLFLIVTITGWGVHLTHDHAWSDI